MNAEDIIDDFAASGNRRVERTCNRLTCDMYR